ncbi:MAG: CHAT domain-containing protein [Rhodospirillaceae bacterium]|nr:CHAT domain-containing protein [Rhodospirillaceae bacterium]
MTHLIHPAGVAKLLTATVLLGIAAGLEACAAKTGSVPLEAARRAEISLGGAPAPGNASPPDLPPENSQPVSGDDGGVTDPPRGLSDKELAQFYYDQAIEQRRSGYPRGWLMALRLAHDHAKRVYGPDVIYTNDNGILRDYLYQRIWAEYQVGDPDLAYAMAEWITTHADGWTPYSAHTILARFYAWVGRIDKARAALAKAEEIWARDPGPRNSEWGLFNRYAATGAVKHAEGDLEAALTAYRGMIASGPDPEIMVGNRESIINALRDLGRTKEAEVEARAMLADAARLSGEHSMTTIYAHVSLVRVLGDQGRTAEALATADKALALGQSRSAHSDGQIFGGLLLEKARLLADTGDYHASLAAFNPLLGTKDTIGWVAEGARWSLIRAEALWQTGQLMDARRIVASVRDYRKLTFGAGNILAAEATGMMAAIDTGLGARDLALSLFQESLPVILDYLESRTSASNAINRERTRRIELIAEAYLDFLANGPGEGVTMEAGVVADSFRLADIGRTPIVHAAIQQHMQRLGATASGTAELIRQQQDLELRIDAMLAQIVALPLDLDPTDAASLRNQIEIYKRERRAALAALQQRDPDFAELLISAPGDLAAVQQSLAPGEALLAIHVGRKASYVWAVPKAGRAAFVRVAVDRSEAAGLIDRLLAAVHPNAQTLGDIPELDIAAARELYRRFVAPVEQVLGDSDTLLTVANRPLGQLPFSLLLTADFTLDRVAEPLFAGYRAAPWLARRFAVVQLPAVRSLSALRGLHGGGRQAQGKSLAAFGAPLFDGADSQGQLPAPALAVAGVSVRSAPIELRATMRERMRAVSRIADLPPLPDTAREVSEIAAILGADPAGSVFTGAAANEAQVKSMNLAQRRILVFATHGLLPNDLPGLSQPALALSDPLASRSEGDGLLTMGEILDLKLDADWVLLSACNTAAGESAGADSLTGLGRAFFYAGARAILASNWPVETVSARLLTTGVFQRQRDDPRLSKAMALQQSMLALMDGPGARMPNGSPLFSYAHPIFWAPFSLVGDGA